MKDFIKHWILYSLITFGLIIIAYKYFGGFHTFAKGYKWERIIDNMPAYIIFSIVFGLLTVIADKKGWNG